MSRSRQGFTIVELLIVVVVIGILASLVLVSYRNMSRSAIEVSLKSDLTNASRVLAMSLAEYDKLPDTISCSVGNSSNNKCITASTGTVYDYQRYSYLSQSSYCLTAKKESRIYNVSSAQTIPKPGGCTGDGVTEDGLVLSVDSYNSISYPGSGLSWLDLSSNMGSLSISGPVFNSSPKTFTFDGNNDRVDFNAQGLTTTATVEMWARMGSGYTNKMLFGWYAYDVAGTHGNLGFNTGNGDIYGISPTTVTSLGLVNNWKHYVFEMRSDVSYSNNKIYINGVQQSLSQRVNTELSSYRNFNGGDGSIASWRITQDYYMPMDLSVFRVYNRSLTQTEVSQNFNALRGRFGI